MSNVSITIEGVDGYSLEYNLLYAYVKHVVKNNGYYEKIREYADLYGEEDTIAEIFDSYDQCQDVYGSVYTYLDFIENRLNEDWEEYKDLKPIDMLDKIDKIYGCY